jgi:hypothetical protein
MMEIETKKARLLRLMASQNWREALRLAAEFRELGEHRDPIQRAHSAVVHPNWSRQMRRDPAADIAAGIEALRQRYQR